MEALMFIKHVGNTRPVPEGVFVIYRCHGTYRNKPIIESVVSMPTKAENLLWDDTPKLTRIAEYAIVQDPKLPSALPKVRIAGGYKPLLGCWVKRLNNSKQVEDTVVLSASA